MKKVLFAMMSSLLTSSIFPFITHTENSLKCVEKHIAVSEEADDIDDVIYEPIQKISSANQDSISKSTTWNMVNHNMQLNTTAYEIFDPNKYAQKTPTEQYSTLVLTNGKIEDTDVNTIKAENIKEINLNGLIYECTDPYIPENNNSLIDALGYDGIYGDDDRKYIDNPKTWPYYATGKMIMRYDNVLNQKTHSLVSRTFIGTGFMEGPNVMVTAGHCVYGDVTSGNGAFENDLYDPRFPDSIVFYPGLSGNSSINSTALSANALVININKDYFQSTQFKDDWAVVELDSNIGNITGWYGKTSNWYSKDYEISTFGYPGDKYGEMWKSVATVTELTNEGIYKLTNDLKGGQSGSGLHVSLSSGKYVCGIGTFYSYYEDENKNKVTTNTGGTQINPFMFHYMNSFVTNHNAIYRVGDIKPTDYRYADAYPTNTFSDFISHNANGLAFQTRRYRTGFIQSEYIVMSPIRQGYGEAYIEYKFDFLIYKIDVDLTYWRSISNEWLTKDNGIAELQTWHNKDWWNPFDSSRWVQKYDLLSDSAALPTDRTQPKTYAIEFASPVNGFRFYSKYNGVMTNNSNRGRICIGDMSVYGMTD